MGCKGAVWRHFSIGTDPILMVSRSGKAKEAVGMACLRKVRGIRSGVGATCCDSAESSGRVALSLMAHSCVLESDF